MGPHPTLESKLRLHDKRQRLQSRIDAFVQRGEDIIADAYENTPERANSLVIGIWTDEDEEAEEENAGDDPWDTEAIPPEKQILPLPSTRKITLESSHLLQTLAEHQLELEKGCANDALHKVRLAISHKSFVYRKKVREAKNYR